MKFKFFSLLAALTAIFVFSSSNFAQENNTGNNTPDSPQIERKEKRFGRMGGRHGHGMMHMRLLNELNLSEAQKQQMSTIAENYKNNIDPQKQELRQIWSQKQASTPLTPDQETRARELFTQMNQAKKKMHDELLGILTPEQRQQLDQKRQEMRQRWQERRQMRQNNQTAPQN
jgi:Spy/CpxP family protein refolding chaperone